jgi:AcrR family transcriptional regulator
MTGAAATRLPRGRHHLTREQVETDQRMRLAVGMAEAVREKGYAATPVADVLRAAGVSRETFYRFYPDKLACFLDAVDLVSAVLLERLAATADGGGTAHDQVDRALQAYFALLRAEPGFARLLLVEVFAAGPEAMARRTELQRRVAGQLAAVLGAERPEARFAVEALVAAISTMVTGPLVAGDHAALDALRPPIVGLVEAVGDAGLLS